MNNIIAEIVMQNNQSAHAKIEVKKEGVLIIYGNGDTLGDFGQFANSLKKEKLKDYSNEAIIIESIQNKNVFFEYLANFNKFKIVELHIFCHSAGGGIYIGYHNNESGDSRMAAYKKSIKENRKITYEEVVTAEIGAVLTDDFLTSKNISNKQKYIDKFSKNNPIIKLWGCNSGISNWHYSDVQGSYYWSALNTKNVPKPAIAQAFADYFQVNTYGAMSGSHIEYKINGVWQILNKHTAKHEGIRLHPDRGNYQLFSK